jgi:uncharacterized membrane protein YeiH
VLDAAGLGLFTAAGTLKALDFGVPVVGACILGMITGIGAAILTYLIRILAVPPGWSAQVAGAAVGAQRGAGPRVVS